MCVALTSETVEELDQVRKGFSLVQGGHNLGGALSHSNAVKNALRDAGLDSYGN